MIGIGEIFITNLSPNGQNKENNKMASPRRRRLRKMLRAGLLKAAGAAEAAAEAVAPAPLVDAPVVEEVEVEAAEEVVKAPKQSKKSKKK
jgi:hypothetical protein